MQRSHACKPPLTFSATPPLSLGPGEPGPEGQGEGPQHLSARRTSAVAPSAVVAGGGIAGLAAAVALRAVGVEAVAHEQAAALREAGAGIGLWPNATRALTRLGVLDAVAATSGRATSITICDARGRTLAHVPVGGVALCAHRGELLAALRAALPDTAVRTAARVEGFHDAGDRVRVSVGDAAAETPLLVGADGLRSRVRAALVGGEPPRFTGMTVWRALGPDVGGTPEGAAVETWGDGARFGRFDAGAAPDGTARTYWYAVQTRREGVPAEDAEVQKAALLRLFDRWHAPVCDAIAATPAEAILCHDVYDRPPVRRTHGGRVVLVGDAAHAATPDLGQSGAMALEDAVALAACVAGAASVPDALAAFARLRRRRTAIITRQSRVAGRVGQAAGLPGRVRNAALRMTPSAAFGALFGWPFRGG